MAILVSRAKVVPQPTAYRSALITLEPIGLAVDDKLPHAVVALKLCNLIQDLASLADQRVILLFSLGKVPRRLLGRPCLDGLLVKPKMPLAVPLYRDDAISPQSFECRGKTARPSVPCRHTLA